MAVHPGDQRPLISIRDLHFRYPGAATDVLAIGALDIRGAGLIALTGASGAGKSTLTEIMAGTLREPYGGSIEVFGVDLQGLKRDSDRQRHLRRIGFIPQDFGLLPGVSIRDILRQDLSDAQVPRQEHDSRITAALDKVGLSEFGEREAQQLSGGQRQRVAIARMLARDVELVIADEPTANLDRTLVGTVVDLFRELASSRPVVIVTHDPVLAAECDRTVLLPTAPRSTPVGAVAVKRRWPWAIAVGLCVAVVAGVSVILTRAGPHPLAGVGAINASPSILHSAVPSTTPAAPITQGEAEAILPLFLVAHCKSLPTETYTATNCPISNRLQSHFANTPRVCCGGSDAWTRSQFNWTLVSVSVDQTASGATAQVVLSPDGTPGYSMNAIDFFLIRSRDGGVLVDDTACTGLGSSTSLYRFPYGQATVSCYSTAPT